MLKPMLASAGDADRGAAALTDPGCVYEPKYDGIRAIASVEPGGPARLWSRLGNEKTAQFPEVADALARWSRGLSDAVVIDGEVVALDAKGRPAGFQQLQGRIHLSSGEAAAARTARETGAGPARVAFIVFDVLRAGGHDVRDQALRDRRDVLERLLRGTRNTGVLRMSEQARGDGRALYARALESGWEGLIAKRADSRYVSGKRSPDWRKIKIVQEQEFVVGGWTEPRSARTHFGALLLGVYEDGALVYVGHTGTGFDERELARVMARLRALEVKTSPFAAVPKTNERPHWVRPALVAQVKFTEWTADARLRHPVYLGLRDDKPPREVRREAVVRPARPSGPRSRAGAGKAPPAVSSVARAGRRRNARTGTQEAADALIGVLREMEDARRDGPVDVGGRSIAVTNLHKVFWPARKLTKGDLFRYYAAVAPYVLPAIEDRPLVMKRFPNGVDAPPFYQHRAADVPANVRVEAVPSGGGAGRSSSRHLVGGDLATLLYTTQLAAISQDPWFSRVRSLDAPDYVALDLDPPDGASFRRVLDVARAVRDELARMGVTGVPKTSGASGLHVYIPLPPGTSYDAGLIFCQIVATLVAHRHPRLATVERAVRARGARVYVDYLQNARGKTLAAAYSARASAFAGVSTPLTWDEVDAGVDREDFTITTVPARLARVGDLWAALRTSKGADLSKAAAAAQENP